MTKNLAHLLLRRSEAGEPAILWEREVQPFLGACFDRLIAQRIVSARAPAEEWHVCEACDCELTFRPIEVIGDRTVAVCPRDRASDLVLEAEDLASYEISVPALMREIATASGFTGEPSEVIPHIWHLGRTAAPRQVFIAVSREAALSPGLVSAIRLLDRSSEIILIAPLPSAAEQIQLAATGMHVVCTDECFPDSLPSFALDLARLEPHTRSAPRLAISRSAKSVTLDGNPKSLPEQSFKLLVLLAEQAVKSPAIVENRRIEDHLWGANVHKITSEVREPVRALRDALATGSADPKSVRALIENRRNPNGYRLALAPDAIQLTP